MATDHTVGAPPSRGSTILANIGWMANSSRAERNSVTANSSGASRAAPCMASAGGRETVGSKVVIEVPGLGPDTRRRALSAAYLR